MKSPSKQAQNTTVDLQNVSPELKSYIYQTIMEFEPFTTPQTIVAVIAKNPLKLINGLEERGVTYDKKELKSMHRISISLAEEGNKIEEEALHEDIYQAIKMAKDKLVKKLCDIQDQVISSTERKIQIDSAVGGGQIH